MKWRWPLVCLALCSLGADAHVPDRFDTVIIDAGHGGDDQGARSADGFWEKDLVLDVALRLAERLRARGLRVVLTRDSDIHVPLEERTSIANDARGDLFVSIHANAAPSQNARGIETYFLSLEASDAAAESVARRENEVFRSARAAPAATADSLLGILSDLIATEHLEESNEFARFAHRELSALTPASARGVKQAPFVVLMGVQMPASLIEIGFLTHQGEARDLAKQAHRNSIADALARAVSAYGRRHDVRRGAALTLDTPPAERTQ